MKSVIKYPGSKARIAQWIIDKFPEHHSYVEPYFGSGAILLNKPQSKIETINDLDNDVCNLFTVIRDIPEPLIRQVLLTPYARNEYDSAFLPGGDSIEQARKFLVRCWQGHAYRTNGYKVGWKNDVQGREAAYAMRNWYRLPGWIADTVDRLKEVQIDNQPAVDVIKRFNYPNVLIYADPPYVLSTRSGKSYKHEMSDSDHIELLQTLLKHRGTVILSGYDNEIYNDYLSRWNKSQINTTAEKGMPRTETLWMNF